MLSVTEFNEIVWDYYNQHGRHDLPWRLPEANGDFDPYKIMVSELMLQQTQVSRVIPKFHEFLMKFPTVRSLAEASLSEVLIVWSGLGYNRRAKFLWQAAQAIATNYAGAVPRYETALVNLPGIGKNTAGAILAYAFNEPVVYVETNIRTIYIHHFFTDQQTVSDADILEKMKETVDTEHTREFYWALMDYGAYLKQTVGNMSKYSKTYAKQSKFEGSRRQIRGQVLRTLAAGPQTVVELANNINDPRLPTVLDDLLKEELISRHSNVVSLYSSPVR